MTAVNSLAFRVCVMFAANPDEHLLSSDICAKFGATYVELPSAFRTALRDGWLQRERQKRSPGGMYRYSAGPELLKLIGRVA